MIYEEGKEGNNCPIIAQGKAIRPYRGIAFIALLASNLLASINLGPMPNRAWGATVRGGDISLRAIQNGTTI